MTVDEFKAANKQEVNPPISFNDMTMQLNMFTVANNIFSKSSALDPNVFMPS